MGYGKIEFIVVIVIVAIMAIILTTGVPSLGIHSVHDIILKYKENDTKAALGSLRTAIAMYYADHDGNYPSANIVAELTQDRKYLDKIPSVHIGRHPRSNNILVTDLDKDQDTGDWAYKVDDSTDSTGKVKGQIWINCTHKDSQGHVWNTL